MRSYERCYYRLLHLLLSYPFCISQLGHFGWEHDPLLLVLGENNPNNGRILSVGPQNSNALS